MHDVLTDENTSLETFSFWMPAQAVISKGSKDGSDKDGKRWIQGIASTDVQDFQGEKVKQSGIDFSYFLKYGYFNNDHKPGAENKVGEPVECRLTKDGLWVKGFLYSDKKAAQDMWDHMNSLSSSGSKRRMGFSIEGKVIKRNGNVIEKCWIQDIAVTPAPVNAHTWAEIAKSLAASEWSKKEEEKEEKALTAASVLVPESLEGNQKDARVAKSFSYAETVAYVEEQCPGISKEAANAVATVIFETH